MALVWVVIALTGVGALVFSSRARVILILAGGLLIFQRQSSLSPDKFAYIGFVLACAITALPKVRRHELGVPLVSWAGTLLVSTALEVVWALHNGATLDFAMRDALPVALVALAPVLAIDRLSARSRRFEDDLILIVASLVAAALYFAHWSALRNASYLSTSPDVGLASFVLPLIGLGWCWSRALARRAIMTGVVPALVIFTLLLSSGSRVALLAIPLLLIPLVFRARHIALALRAAAATAVIGLLIPIFMLALGVNASFLAQRFAAIQNPALLLTSDQSALDRQGANAVALREVARSPLLGTGPGVEVSTSGTILVLRSPQSDSFDTPLASVLSYGTLGALIQLAFLFKVYRLCRVRTNPLSPERLGLDCSAGAFALFQLVESPILDKGLFLAMVCVLPAVLRDHYERR